MRTKHDKRWRLPVSGVTLVEALAGSVLLGTLLVSILIAKGQLTIQARRAQDRLAACQVLDDFLEGWWPTRADAPHEAAGTVAGHAGWRWQMRRVTRETATALLAEVVAVEVFAPGQSDTTPAARVDILLPVTDKSDETSDGTNAG